MTFSIGIGVGFLIAVAAVISLFALVVVTGAYGPRF